VAARSSPNGGGALPLLVGRDRKFADSLLEGDGFEPSALRPESSVSAGLAPSVAANLHPYSAQICTPASTESCYLKLSHVGLAVALAREWSCHSEQSLCASNSTKASRHATPECAALLGLRLCRCPDSHLAAGCPHTG